MTRAKLPSKPKDEPLDLWCSSADSASQGLLDRIESPLHQSRVFALALGLCAGCQPPPAPPPTPTPRATSQVRPPAQAPAAGQTTEPLPLAKPVLTVSEPAVLQELERRGFGFRQFALEAGDATADNAAGYLESARYQTLVAVIERELQAIRAQDRASGVGMRYAHRVFDARWLRSKSFRFELSGVVNRVDRRAFASNICGELRFIYRLAYDHQIDGQRLRSRVPLTLNVVRWLPGDATCSEQAKRWLMPAAGGASLAEALTNEQGPLSESAQRETVPKSVEVNLQSVRWPATVRPNMTGHAEYLLKVFRVRADGWEESTLENTPDVGRLRARPTLRSELWQWLHTPEALRAADEGTLLVPEKFLAKRAISVAPHGLARLANRPYSELFTAEPAPAGSDLSTLRSFTSADGLLRRLDSLTCMGCHQSKSLAGFHFLGEDAADQQVDALAVPFSPHFADELVRRADYVAKLASGAVPNELRLPAERMGGGGYGAACGLDASFAGWTCDPGYTCKRLHDAKVGQCMPQTTRVGDACEMGTLRPAANPHRDFVRLDRPSDCGAGRHCERSGVGFPGGMCSGGCSNLTDEAVCGGIALLTEFNQCLARRLPFETCVREQTRPGALRACSTTTPCRDDYVCARMQDGSGACIPPYFLFQLRVDGHSL